MVDAREAAQRSRRRDARDNRERIVAAARRRFGADGLDASLNAIAREAGVSIGTLYNHFPSREELIEETFLELAEESVRSAEAALTSADPWDGLVGHLIRMAEMQAADRGFTDLCVRSLPADSPVEQVKARGGELFHRLITRVQDSGELRPDIDITDIGLLLWSIVRASEDIRAQAPHVWRRHLAILLDGLRAEAAHPLPEPPLDRQLLRTALALGR
ncbi:TetR/AcrR family transcriptional regulator [Nocardia sp. CDC159]|uniref:TetR/AcrR family transcriptional regulator n=1 Tax=Nocardia pulmonis TaxID=2951408 RepID=A0A9X2IZ92_9NOCA|nr:MULTISPECIES: TetR/AcrR family transcriptional regulator [Nocardia]MCM6776499.1 TetR/AcrR family transcriptional regulator [Nocardia pulmonis]MCM6788923.1 TetR/AcrR family transcriptional regulator [Nocardia sp. CDC159]